MLFASALIVVGGYGALHWGYGPATRVAKDELWTFLDPHHVPNGWRDYQRVLDGLEIPDELLRVPRWCPLHREEFECRHRAWLAFLVQNSHRLPWLMKASQAPSMGMPIHPVRFHQSWAEFYHEAGNRDGFVLHQRALEELSQRERPLVPFEGRGPNLVRWRALVGLVLVAGEQEAHEGRLDRAVEHLSCASRMVEQLWKRPLSLDKAIAQSLHEWVGTTWRSLLVHYREEWTDSLLGRLEESLWEEPRRALRDLSELEWQSTRYAYRMAFCEDSGGDGRLNARVGDSLFSLGRHRFFGRSLDPISWLWHAREEEALHELDRRRMEALERFESDGEWESERPSSFSDRVRFGVLAGHDFTSTLCFLSQVQNKLLIEQEATRLTLGLLKHFRHSGSWPSSIESLDCEGRPGIDYCLVHLADATDELGIGEEVPQLASRGEGKEALVLLGPSYY